MYAGIHNTWSATFQVPASDQDVVVLRRRRRCCAEMRGATGLTPGTIRHRWSVPGRFWLRTAARLGSSGRARVALAPKGRTVRAQSGRVMTPRSSRHLRCRQGKAPPRRGLPLVVMGGYGVLADDAHEELRLGSRIHLDHVHGPGAGNTASSERDYRRVDPGQVGVTLQAVAATSRHITVVATEDRRRVEVRERFPSGCFGSRPRFSALLRAGFRCSTSSRRRRGSRARRRQRWWSPRARRARPRRPRRRSTPRPRRACRRAARRSPAR